ncbi:hypothetical protein N7475_009141 [Penicillium sp. IBT 31633x]|nr:hypothetical protein N7475_009141 [Penicillium sp. IBT 31633x]
MLDLSVFFLHQLPTQEVNRRPYSSKIQPQHSDFVECLELDYSDIPILKQTDWKLILKEVLKVDGCSQITWSIPMEDNQTVDYHT